MSIFHGLYGALPSVPVPEGNHDLGTAAGAAAAARFGGVSKFMPAHGSRACIGSAGALITGAATQIGAAATGADLKGLAGTAPGAGATGAVLNGLTGTAVAIGCVGVNGLNSEMSAFVDMLKC